MLERFPYFPPLSIPKLKQYKLLNVLLAVVLVASVVGLFALRIYAVYESVPIRTWDDMQHREYALRGVEFPGLTAMGALDDILFPNGKLFVGHRTVGYHAWLLLGLKLSLSGNSEQTLQLVNVVLFIIQAIVLFLFARWATRNSLISGTLTFLYLSSPIVFGMNRWIMTENHVFTALLVLGYVPCWLVTRQAQGNIRREILYGFVAAWLMGMFAGLREYATISYLAISGATFLALYRQKRWDALLGFAFTWLAFTGILLEAWARLIPSMVYRTALSEYFHPMTRWIPHVISYSSGPALTIGLGLLTLLLFYQLLHRFSQWMDKKLLNWQEIKTHLSPLGIIWIVYLSLLLLYCVAILKSENRSIRCSIPLLVSLMNALLLGIKLYCPVQIWQKSLANLLCLTLIISSWTVLHHQLFVAFEGGRSYKHHAHNLEYYNYPLGLPKLNHPSELHTY